MAIVLVNEDISDSCRNCCPFGSGRRVEASLSRKTISERHAEQIDKVTYVKFGQILCGSRGRKLSNASCLYVSSTIVLTFTVFP